MNVFILKLIALITMVIDHYGAIFQSNIDIYRMVGRIAFPIYAFLLVEGYHYTRDIKKYAKRLLVFAFISEIPFDLAFSGRLELMHQNIFFTLFIGLMTMYFLDRREDYNINKIAIIMISVIVSTLLLVDYSFIGIVYILAFYFNRKKERAGKILSVGGIMLLINLTLSGYLQQFSLLSLVFIYFYNGKLGPKNKFIQGLFYTMYPLHLLVFYLIK